MWIGIGAALIAHAPLDAEDIGDRLDACAALSPAFRGVRDILSPHVARGPDLLDRPGFLLGLRALAARGLIFEAMLTPPQMQRAAEVLGQVLIFFVLYTKWLIKIHHVGHIHRAAAKAFHQGVLSMGIDHRMH